MQLYFCIGLIAPEPHQTLVQEQNKDCDDIDSLPKSDEFDVDDD